MKIKNLSFPYPVLGIGDDILPAPYLTPIPVISESEDNCSYEIEIQVDMRNSDISNLIKSGIAIYVCEVECVYTRLRRCFKSKTNNFPKIKLPKQDVGKLVTFQVSIVCLSNVKSYINKNFHEDYDGFSFDLEPGDLLAFIGEFSYDFELNYSQIKSVGSFMQVTENKYSSETLYSFEGDKIDIKLPSELYEKYRCEISQNLLLKDILHSSVVFNALVAALLCFNNDDKEEYNMKLWERTLKYRIDTEPNLAEFKDTLETKDINDVLKLAQKLLMNPYNRLFEILPKLQLIEEEEL